MSVSAAMRMSYGQSELSNKCCGAFCVCEHNDAAYSPIGIALFDDVISLCIGTQLRPAVSNQIHKPLNAGDARYTMLRCCSESVRERYYLILCVKTQLRPIVANQKSQVFEIS